MFSPFGSGIAASYILSSLIGFCTALMGWQMTRHATLPDSLLRAPLVPCLGLALAAESVYIASRHGGTLGTHAILHFARNITLDLRLPFMATLLTVQCIRTRQHLIKLGMGWWLTTGFLFYWWTGAPPITPLLALAILVVSFTDLATFVRHDSPSPSLMLLGAALWGLLLVNLVFTGVKPMFSDTAAAPIHDTCLFPVC